MSSIAECPYCGCAFNYDGDCEGFTQDSEQAFNCAHPDCGKEFLATVYWDLCITGERVKPPAEEKGSE